MPAYDRSKLKFYHIAVPMGFASDSLTERKRTRINKGTVYQVDLVFSHFRSSTTFSQEELNRRRLETLRKHLPSLFSNTQVKWNLIRQTSATTKEDAQKLFHGFVFHMRIPIYVSKRDGRRYRIDGKAERDLLHGILGDTLPAGYKTNLPIPETPILDTTITSKTYYPKYTRYGSLWNAARRKRRLKGMQFKKKRIWKRTLEYTTYRDTVTEIDSTVGAYGSVYSSTLGEHPFYMDPLTHYSVYRDSVVMKTFLDHPEWENMLVVEDVTGSMYPYTGQTMAWRRLAQPKRRIMHWAFFNDGDSRPDGPIGRSDGVYCVASEEQKPVEGKAMEAMTLGGGGGGPENDIEAMLKALDRSDLDPEVIVLIADNWAPVRDLKLFSRLKARNVPVYVIVCGAIWGSINVEYLEIARRTGGKVFTIEGELEGLLELSEGDIIDVGDQKFEVSKGKLVLIRGT